MDDVVPNPKQEGSLWLESIKDNDLFENTSWSNQLRVFESLNVMELEIETLEENLNSGGEDGKS